MRAAAISDLHGTLPEMPEPADVLLITGDFAYCRKGDTDAEAVWLDQKLRPWVERQPAERVLITAGNHDFIWEREPERAAALKLPVDYLQDSGVEIGGIRFWGTPWQPPFYQWAFNASEMELRERFALIPDETHVLLSHGPPLGSGDLTTRGERVGSHALTKRIKELPELTHCFFGHIHEARGRSVKYGAQLINCSAVDVSYTPYPDPFVYVNL